MHSQLAFACLEALFGFESSTRHNIGGQVNVQVKPARKRNAGHAQVVESLSQHLQRGMLQAMVAARGAHEGKSI